MPRSCGRGGIPMENAAVQERAQAPHMLTGAQRFYIGVKRAADVALSLLGLVLLSPVSPLSAALSARRP